MYEPSLDDRYRLTSGTIFLTGIHAIVRFLLDKQRRDVRSSIQARRSLITGYEGSPLGGLDLEISLNLSLLNELGPVVHQAAINEKTAAAAVHGSQYTGTVDGFWYGKAHGVKWALDEFSLANIAGTGKDSGVVLFAGDDHMAKSSGYPASSEQSFRDARIPTFYPANVAEVITYAHHALALSRYAGTICALKLVTPVCDGAATIDISPEHPNIVLPSYLVAGKPYNKTFHPVVISTGSIPFEEELTTVKLEIAEQYTAINGIDTIKNRLAENSLGIITMGKNYPDVIQALRSMGQEDQVPVLKLGMIYPCNRKTIRDFATGLQTIVVVEEKGPFVEEAVARALIGRGEIQVYGERGPDDGYLIPTHGELNPDLLTLRLGPLLNRLSPSESVSVRMEALQHITERSTNSFPRRAAHYCPGCPHSVSARAPAGEISGGEIGCSSLDAYIEADGRGVKWIPTMGLGGAIYNGIFPFNGNQHLFQNIGDGTVLHSGLITLFSSLSHGANITYKILWNHVVAMTGGQEITGQPTLDDFSLILLGMGVRDITVVSKYPEQVKLERSRVAAHSGQTLALEPRSHLEAVQEALAKKPGVKVLIYDQECATEQRRRNKRQGTPVNHHVFIHERVCEGCGDCGRQSMCLALVPKETEFGHKTDILQSACNQDLSCIKGECPSFVSVETINESKPRRPAPPKLQLSDLTEPLNKVVIDKEYAIHIVGIGGTGVVTLAHVLGYAALFDGKKVNELNRTGLAQKGGPVESPIVLGNESVPISSHIGDGQCDLFLATDIVGAINPINLKVASSQRTVAVVSSSAVPTSKMVYDPDYLDRDIEGMTDLIDQYTRSEENFYIDAQDYVARLFGNHLFANIFQLGTAYQAGRIPLTAENIEKAISLNGQAVDENIQAFRWGRTAISNRSHLDDMVSLPKTNSDELTQRYQKRFNRTQKDAYRRLIDRILIADENFRKTWVSRVGELIAFQDVAYAERYVNTIERVMTADSLHGGAEHGYLITTHTAFILHKLMAYKDEYEVARLLTEPGDTNIADKFDGPVKISYYLHPPLLRALGLKRKLRLGPWFHPFLRLTALCKRLRGTLFDPFGHTTSRREERELVVWYEDLVDQVLLNLTPDNYLEISKLLWIPNEIRGYEHVKHRTVLDVKEKAGEMLQGLLQRRVEKTVEITKV